jgi:hypothetical protein
MASHDGETPSAFRTVDIRTRASIPLTEGFEAARGELFGLDSVITSLILTPAAYYR